MYRLIPCFHGLCASPSAQVTNKVRKAKSTKGVEGVKLLPGGIEDDTFLHDESIPFSRKIELSAEDIRNLDCSSSSNFSFTYYGPAKQDKPTNQDFALSGHFTDLRREISRFSILADGISNGFGFSQRGAQLSCLAAYECLKDLHEESSNFQRKLSEQDVEAFRNTLANKINEYFQDDREHLLRLYDDGHTEPPNISSKVWQNNFKNKPERWYGNTLLVSYLSPSGGFVVYAGDGGIILIKGQNPPIEKKIMRSDESSAISRFVSTGISGAKFLGGLIEYEANYGFIEIISVTDGLDRTYQLNDLDLSAVFSKGASPRAVIDQIRKLEKRVSGEVDFDNYSIGRVFLSLSPQPHTRMVDDSASAPMLPKPGLGETADVESYSKLAPVQEQADIKKKRIAA